MNPLLALSRPETTDHEWIAARLNPEWIRSFLNWCTDRRQLPRCLRWTQLAWDTLRQLEREEAIELLHNLMLACDGDYPDEFDGDIRYHSRSAMSAFDRLLLTEIGEARHEG